MSEENKDEPTVKTKFRGPGEWRSQAAELEKEQSETESE